MATLVATLVLAACSAGAGQYRSAAEKTIRTDVADRAELGPLRASCDRPASTGTGSVFDCRATTAAGTTFGLRAEIVGRNEVRVTSAELLTPADLGALGFAARRRLAERGELDVASETLDCGVTAVVLSAGEPLVCAITGDPATGRREARITILDPLTRELEVRADPRR